jgi:WD40 repeat protein
VTKLRYTKTLAATSVMLASLLACALPGAIAATQAPAPTAAIAASPVHPEFPSDTPPPPTAVPPTPTPLAPVIDAGNVGRLTLRSTFGEGELLRTLSFSPDGTTLASAGGNTDDFAIRLWDVASGIFVRSLDTHTSIIWDLAFSPDGRMLASVSADKTAKIWDWRAGTVIKSLDFPDQVVSVAFSPDGQTLAVGGVDGFPNASIWTYSVSSWEPGLKLAESWNIPAIVFSPDSQFLVGGGTSRNARTWRMSDGANLFTLSHSGQVDTLAISPDGSTIASGLCEVSGDNGACSRGAVWLWDLHTGKLLRKFSDFDAWVQTVAFSPDGSLLIAGAQGGTLRFYDTADDSTVFTTHTAGPGGVLAVSPDGRLLAATSNDNQIELWAIGP